MGIGGVDTIADRWRLAGLVVRSLRDGIGVVEQEGYYCDASLEVRMGAHGLRLGLCWEKCW